MHQSEGKCPVCDQNHTTIWQDQTQVQFSCPRCGKYASAPSVLTNKLNFSPAQTGVVSGWLSENQETFVSIARLKELATLQGPLIGEKADKILRYMAESSSIAGTRFTFQNSAGFNQAELFDSGSNATLSWFHLIARAWAVNDTEVRFLLEDYLRRELGFLHGEPGGYKISPKGWARVDLVRNINPQSQIGFIAMWFDAEMKEAWSAIAQGIEAARYQPLRIDQRQHNNKIDDEIVAAIRGSRFVVSDFTGHRGGVYFEAGFAMGLGIPVIWLCRRDELEKAHFDTRQYNFIVWEQTSLSELTKALKNRIEATIGRGPVPESNMMSVI